MRRRLLKVQPLLKEGPQIAAQFAASRWIAAEAGESSV